MTEIFSSDRPRPSSETSVLIGPSKVEVPERSMYFNRATLY